MKTILCFGDSNLRRAIPGSLNEKTGLFARYPKDKRWAAYITKYVRHKIYTIGAILFLVNSIVLSFFVEKETSWALMASAIGLLFSALKYNLDRAHYHKDLFEKRFEIYSIANEALWHWASDHSINDEIYKKISNDFMGRAYYLFDKEIYEFIKNFRSDLLSFYSSTGKNMASKENKKERKRLVDLVNNPEKFRDKFRNLAIQFY